MDTDQYIRAQQYLDDFKEWSGRLNPQEASLCEYVYRLAVDALKQHEPCASVSLEDAEEMAKMFDRYEDE